ncbi:thyrotropin-releasing hormone receptor-like [Ruditapes philippinarum]|uniref:thyrotropin-releasing hormone receptor-like n=1 Tax=Ruditapes philippinarum TaxID=129788 RepID=UPI00295C12EB|nr:thyrotropin-releasing hormone receptor-like [Ruditapes philippinarum]
MDDYPLLNYYSMMTKNDTYYDYYFNYEETLFEQALKWFEIAFIVPIGVLGNILVVCVLSKKTYEKSSTAVFFSALAVSDILILVSGLYNILTVGNDTNIDCKIFTSLWICSGQTSSCILATVAVERAVSVQNPHKAKFIFTARSAKIIMISMVLFVFVLNAIMMVWYDIGGDRFFEEMYCHSNDLYTTNGDYYVDDFGSDDDDDDYNDDADDDDVADIYEFQVRMFEINPFLIIV